jgi:hypothetical protein
VIQRGDGIVFAFNSGAETRTLWCTVIFGQVIIGRTYEDMNFLMGEIHHGRRVKLTCKNFFMTVDDAFWMASFLQATDKQITTFYSETWDVVNDRSNLEKIFNLVKNFNVAATLDLKFLERNVTA